VVHHVKEFLDFLQVDEACAVHVDDVEYAELVGGHACVAERAHDVGDHVLKCEPNHVENEGVVRQLVLAFSDLLLFKQVVRQQLRHAGALRDL